MAEEHNYPKVTARAPTITAFSKAPRRRITAPNATGTSASRAPNRNPRLRWIPCSPRMASAPLENLKGRMVAAAVHFLELNPLIRAARASRKKKMMTVKKSPKISPNKIEENPNRRSPPSHSATTPSLGEPAMNGDNDCRCRLPSPELRDRMRLPTPYIHHL
nr:hypothetical protein Iba_chr07dCG2970 [Ipomoea batatas]